MKFTIIFPSGESADLSIGAVFTPCLVWVEGDHLILNPHPENPHYLKGDLQTLLQKTELRKRIASYSKTVTIVAHPIGHGTQEYLDMLVSDLEVEGFTVKVVYS